jgi:signal transduction histidine kinase
VIHPVFARSRRLPLYVAAWLPPASLLATVLARGSLADAAPAVAVAYPLTLVYAFICLSAWYVCRRAPLGRSTLLWVVLNALGTATVSSGLWMALGRAWVATLGQAPAFARAAALFGRDTALLFTTGILVYLLATAVSYLVGVFEDARAAERRALELQVLAREAELKALRAQVDPHFLFNSLHSISALTGSDPAGARRMCVLLGEFLRSSMRLGSQARIPLADELALAQRFLEIEHVRFGDRLVVDARVADDAGPCLVPPLLLQPLVENAVKHGVANMLEGGTIRLEARRDGIGVRVAVENPCDPERRLGRRTGVGLENVRKRLAAQYGLQASVSVTERPDNFRVELTIPWATG